MEEAVFQKMCFRNSNLMIYDEKMIYQFRAVRKFEFYFQLFFRFSY